MIALLPRDMPAFETLLDNIGSPHPDRLAAALGVSRRTVYRWFETGAPRLASLAIWPLTRWGASSEATRAQNARDLAEAHARALQREAATLRRRIVYLEKLGTDLASNGPLWDSPAAAAAASTAAADQLAQLRR
jgi:AcrR family transcriptional regulator